LIAGLFISFFGHTPDTPLSLKSGGIWGAVLMGA